MLYERGGEVHGMGFDVVVGDPRVCVCVGVTGGLRGGVLGERGGGRGEEVGPCCVVCGDWTGYLECVRG